MFSVMPLQMAWNTFWMTIPCSIFYACRFWDLLSVSVCCQWIILASNFADPNCLYFLFSIAKKKPVDKGSEGLGTKSGCTCLAGWISFIPILMWHCLISLFANVLITSHLASLLIIFFLQEEEKTTATKTSFAIQFNWIYGSCHKIKQKPHKYEYGDY